MDEILVPLQPEQPEQLQPHDETEPEPEGVRAPVDLLADAVSELVGQTQRFHERAAAMEDTIRHLHARVEELQTDQVRTLLKPVIQRLAALHAQSGEAAERANGAGESAERDLAYFAVALEDTLGLLDIESIGAVPGLPFDASQHHAVQVALTNHPELDRTIVHVLRQGFTYAGAARVLLPAQVVIHRHEPADAS